MSRNIEVKIYLTHVLHTEIGEALETHFVIGYDGERWFYLSAPKTNQLAREIAEESKGTTAWVDPNDYLTEADLTAALVNLAER